MNIALIGYGSIAEDHAGAIRALGDATATAVPRIMAVMGRRLEPTREFAARVGADLATTDLDEVLARADVDAVIVCSPSPVHAEQVERCLHAGKHVLCEIPLALSLADADRLAELARSTGRQLMVCHTRRFNPAYVEARRMIAEGAIRVHAIFSRYGFQRRENVNWRGRRRSWTDNLIWHHGGHVVDAALWLLGASAVEVAARVAPPSAPLGIPMDLSISMRTPAGQIISIAMSYNTHFPLDDCLIIGEETSLLIEGDRLRSIDGPLVEPVDGLTIAAPIARQDAEFFAAVREGREPAVSAAQIRPAMVALQAVQDAADAGAR